MGIALAAIVPDKNSGVVRKPDIHRILVVDDNEACAQTMMWTMEMLGHTAKMALDGQSAIALAKTFCPDIILLDIGLPDMNGYDICQAMRKEPALANSIFIAQTGWGQKEHYDRSREAGFDYHLVKPIDLDVLKNIILALDRNIRLVPPATIPSLEAAQ